MANILITSIGNGTYDAEKKEHTYRPAKYVGAGKQDESGKQDKKDKKDKKVVESAYVLDALREIYTIDKCILVGTAGSNWAAFYEHLFKSGRLNEMKEEYLLALLELSEQKEKHKLPPEDVRLQLEPLKQAMGQFCCAIIVLKYGLDDAEILQNFALLSAVDNHIQNGNSIYFDITHSFRSLALYEYLAVSYLQNVLQKNVKLEFVSYGMFDFARENGGLAPIVDLSQLLRLTDWIKASEEYNRFGTAKLLAELLESDRIGLELSRESQKALRRLGDPMITSNLEEFRNLIKNCKGAVKQLDESQGQAQIVGYILRDLAQRFGDEALQNRPLMIARLARWHFEKARYIEAAITLQEFLMNYCAELKGYNRENFSEDQDIVFQRQLHRQLHSKTSNSVVGQFAERYLTFKDNYRNPLCHGKHLPEAERKGFAEFIKYFDSVYSRQFYQNPVNEEALRTLLGKISV